MWSAILGATGQTATSWPVRLLMKQKEKWLRLFPPTMFFIVGFNLITFSTNLILAEHLVHTSSLLVATMAALVVGKAVVLADKMRFLRRFDTAPLIQPILFKTSVYWFFVFIARLWKANLSYTIGHGSPTGVVSYMLHQFSWHRFAFIQIWIFVLFLVYVTGTELNKLFGQGELWRILFTRSSTALKLTRRERVRALARLNRLAERHSVPELLDPGSAVHRECLLLMAGFGINPETTRPSTPG